MANKRPTPKLKQDKPEREKNVKPQKLIEQLRLVGS
jgi:hypothetical protein